MRYTYKQFKSEYPDEDACLEAVFQNRFGELKDCPHCGVVNTKFYRVKKRQSYACMHCGYHLYPLAGTIFRKTTTPLTSWFHAIYLFSVAKNGVSAKELERHLGVTYKTAWRMAKQIRLLMQPDSSKLTGVVEMDETYYGGRTVGKGGGTRYKTPIIGAVEKDGRARAQVVDYATGRTAKTFIKATAEAGIELHTDTSTLYKWTQKECLHYTVNHSIGEYAVGNVHTNTIEGLWGQLKRSIDGTYHVVSPKYLQQYVNEFIFRYNFRTVPICPLLLARVGRLS